MQKIPQESYEIKPMKLKEAGFLVRWAREQSGLSQSRLAQLMLRDELGELEYDALDDDRREKETERHRSFIANIESDRTQVPLAFLGTLAKLLDLPEDWHSTVAKPIDSGVSRTGRHSSTLIEKPVLIRRIPNRWDMPLRSVYIMDPKQFKRRASFPHIFDIVGHEPDAENGRYPELLADVIESDEDANPPYLRKGDKLAFRTDLNPQARDLVLCTSKDKGRPVRRYIVSSGGGMALRDPAGKLPDISFSDIDVFEGVYVGRVRTREDDSDPANPLTNVIHRPLGIKIDDL